MCVIWGCHREAAENCTLLCYYASSGNFTTTRRAQFLATLWCRPQIAQILLARRHKYHSPTFLVCTTHISKFFITQVKVFWQTGRQFLLLNTTRVAEKIFPPKNLCVCVCVYIYISYYLVLLVPRCLYCCLRILKPGGLELQSLEFLGRRLIQ